MIRKIYLVHHTHMDIGYTDLPEEVMRFQRRYLDSALRLCENDPDFRWTIESSRLLKDYVCHRSEADVRRLLTVLRHGQMELMAFDCQPLLELCSPAEQMQICAWAANEGRKSRFNVSCAMLDDIGGWPLTLADFCHAHGVKYLIAGVGAYQVFLPWEEKLPHLFHHRSPHGNRITVWNLGIDRSIEPQASSALLAVYGLGANYLINPWKREFHIGHAAQVEAEGIAEPDERRPEERFAEFAARLDAEHYPYEEVMLQYGGDNRGPDPALTELLRRINETGKLPEIELTTPSVFMRLMEDRYGHGIPEFGGMLADPWVIRCNPAPAALKSYREAQRKYMTAIRLHEMSQCGGCDEKLAEIADALALYSDHTCGLSVWHAPNVRVPGEDLGTGEYLKMRKSWHDKRLYADFAAKYADEVSAISVGRRCGGMAEMPLAGVFNPASYLQSGLVTLYTGRDGGNLRQLHDDAGNAVPFEDAGHHRYFAAVPDLKPQEVRYLYGGWEWDRDLATLPPSTCLPMPSEWSNPYFTLHFDAENHIESMTVRGDDPRGYDRTASEFPFLEPILELPVDFRLDWAKAGMEPLTRVEYPKPEYYAAGVLRSGELTDTVERRGRFPGRCDFVMRWKLYHHLPRIDIELEIAKPETAALESFYLSCPLSGEARRWRLHTADSSIDLAEELLPGSMRDCFYAHRGISCLVGERWWTMYSPDVPVTHIGAPRHFRWDRERDFRHEKAAFFPQIYHNFLITDAPAFQKINEVFRFSLRMNCDRPVMDVESFYF